MIMTQRKARRRANTQPSGFDSLFLDAGEVPPPDIRPPYARGDMVISPVGRDFHKDPASISTLSRGLAELGFIDKRDAGISGVFTPTLESGLLAFQQKEQKKNKDFKADGFTSVKTNTALGEALKDHRARKVGGLELLPANPHNTQMRKPGESPVQTTEQLKAPQRISLTLLNRAQQIRNSSAARVEAVQGRLAERNARNRALNDDATLEGGNDGGIASQAARDAIAFVKENPLEAADIAASFTEPYGTARDVVDIGAGTASALYNEATGDRENANAGWLQATTGGAAVFCPFASGVAIRKGMDVYDYAKATRRRAGNPDTAEGLGELMSHPKASPILPRKGSFEQSYPEGAFGKDGAKLLKGARLEFDVDGAAIHPNAFIVGHGNVGSPNISASPRDIEVIGGNLARIRSATPDDSKFDMANDFGEFRPKKGKSEKGGRTIETGVKQNEILLNPQLNRTERHRTQAH
jgi:hypothetical protein